MSVQSIHTTSSESKRTCPLLSTPDEFPSVLTPLFERHIQLLHNLAQHLMVDFAQTVSSWLVDPITGLYLRQVGLLTLEREVERTRRDGSELAVIIGDVDHLRELNAAIGHERANQTLRAVGEILRNEVRRADLACRMTAGDEFLVILPSVGLQGARVTAERIRLAVQKVRLPVDCRLTVSLGCAQLRSDDDINGLITRADESLYESKNKGRNCVT